MGGTAGIIQGTFGFDNTPFINAMNDAEKIAQKGANNVQNKFLSIFKRSPNMRAERAFSGLAQSLASGDIAGGIEAITARMTGMGIVAGVAIGAGVAIFMKFKEQIDAAKEAHSQLEQEMLKRPISVVTKLSSEGMEQALQKREQLAEDVRKKTEASGFGSNIIESLQAPLAFLTQGKFGSFGDSKGQKERIQAQQDVNKSEVDAKDIMLAQAGVIETIGRQKRMELSGDEHALNISKIMLETEQARAALQSKGVTKAAFDKSDEALSANAELMISAENKRAGIKEQSLAIEEKMAKLIRGGLSTEEQKKVRAGLELKMLDSEIGSEQSPIKKRALQLQRQQKENEIRSMSKPPTPANPFAFGTAANRNFESEQGGFGTIAARSKEAADANQFGTLSNAAMLRGESPMKAASQATIADVVDVIEDTNEIIRKAWLSQ